jgi:hypothetical protein
MLSGPWKVKRENRLPFCGYKAKLMQMNVERKKAGNWIKMEKLNAFEVFVGSNLATILHPLNTWVFFMWKEQKISLFSKIIQLNIKGLALSVAASMTAKINTSIRSRFLRTLWKGRSKEWGANWNRTNFFSRDSNPRTQIILINFCWDLNKRLPMSFSIN